MTEPRKRIVCVGEVMIEMSRGSDGRFNVAAGGDTFNTAVYLARRGIDTAYATALGDDPYSDGILALASAEGVSADLILRVPARLPGLYLIETNPVGERTFYYWRDNSPARDLFELPDWSRVAEAMLTARIVYFSGITLALYSNIGLGRFLAALEMARQAGASVVFDGNYRPRAWKGDIQRTRTVYMEALKRVDVALPTFDDEALLWGDPAPETTVERLQAFGIAEVVVKNGPNSALVASNGQQEFGAGARRGRSGRHHRGRRQLQCRLHGRPAERGKSRVRRRRRASPRRREDPAPRRHHAASGAGALT